MIENSRNNEQIYGRNDMIMLDPNNKIYGSLGLADNYVMKTEEGTRLILSNPKLGKFGDVLTEFNIYGRSEQFSTTGAQLLNENVEKNSRGVFIKINGSTATFKGTVSDEANIRVNIQKNIKLKPGKYTASSSNKKIVADFSAVKANGETIYNNHIEIDGTEKVVNFRVLFGLMPSAKGDVINETTNLMFNEGDIALPYEPYTGGKPSPSSDYPQEIKSVVNPTVKVCGKNLWKPIAGGHISNIDGSITKVSEMNVAVTDFIKISKKDITVIARNFSLTIKDSFAYRIGFYNAERKWIKNIIPSDGNKYSINTFNIKDAEYIRVSAPSGVYDTIQIEFGSEATSYEPYHEQNVILPYTLNAIPVASDGNVTIDGQQYIADYIDVERGKLVRMCKYKKLLSPNIIFAESYKKVYVKVDEIWDVEGNYTSRKFSILCSIGIARLLTVADSGWDGKGRIVIENVKFTHIDEAKNYFDNNDVYACYPIPTPEEIPITLEEVSTFKQLMTYYPVTIIENNYNTWMKATYKSTESV